MELLVVGAGSLGSLLGGLLARAHDVTLLGRDPHMARVAEAGLEIVGLVDEVVHPAAVTDVSGCEADVALVTTKSYDTAAAAQTLAAADVGAVCSLQNGLGNEETLADALACPVLGGSATYGADLEAPGRVRFTGEGTVTVGAFDGGEAVVDDLVDAFVGAGVNAEATEDIRETLWRKVAINAAINPTTALTRRRNRAVGEAPLASTAAAAARETAAVAREGGVDLDDEAVVETVLEVAEATGSNRSSMLQDVLAGTRTEIEAINGAVVRRAEDAAVPVNATLTALVRSLEERETEG